MHVRFLLFQPVEKYLEFLRNSVSQSPRDCAQKTVISFSYKIRGMFSLRIFRLLSFLFLSFFLFFLTYDPRFIFLYDAVPLK